MDQNIFQDACLVQLSISCWMGSRMLEANVMEQIGSSDWLKGRKHLVNPEFLSPVRAVISRARKDLEKGALPFPISGLTLVPKSCLASVEESLMEHRNAFYASVSEFERQYADAREAARRSLGHLFSEHDYPVDIRKKFSFEWRYFTIQTPGQYGILTPEIYEREIAKFEAMMEETRELATVALREEFAEHVNHIVERLTNKDDGTPKIFKNSMIEKIQDYLGSFGSRNFFKDDQLESLVEQARSIVAGVNPNALRDNFQFKSQIREKMERVKEELDKAIVDAPRRKIRFAA